MAPSAAQQRFFAKNPAKSLQNQKNSLPLQSQTGTPDGKNGVLAQLVERLNGIQKVRSSILLCSTKKRTANRCPFFCAASCAHPPAAQVLPLPGAGVIFGGGPAPQNGHLRAPVAQVPTLFPHLRQKTSAPAPESPYTCANSFSRKPSGLQSIDSQKILEVPT